MQDELKKQSMYDFVEQWQQSGPARKRFVCPFRTKLTPPFRAKLTPLFEQTDPFYEAIFTVIPAD